MRFDGDRLKTLRVSRRLDQHSLAEAARRQATGITQSQISRYENGQEPSGRNALALAAALGIDVRDLYTSDGDDDEEDSELPLSPADFVMLGDLMRRLGPTLSVRTDA